MRSVSTNLSKIWRCWKEKRKRLNAWRDQLINYRRRMLRLRMRPRKVLINMFLIKVLIIICLLLINKRISMKRSLQSVHMVSRKKRNSSHLLMLLTTSGFQMNSTTTLSILMIFSLKICRPFWLLKGRHIWIPR